MATSTPNVVQLAATTPKNVDLGGDVNLLTGPQGCQVRLRVSRALLTLASTYFRTIFGPNFSEATAAEQGKDIVLVDDEPDAITNLLKIMHMQYTWPKPMSPLELLALSVVADKYRCVKAINLSVEALFPRDVEGFNTTPMLKLATAAYLLDNPTFFFTYTQRLLMGCTESLSVHGLKESGLRVPSIAWLMLEALRADVYYRLLAAFTSVVRRPCSANFSNCPRMADWFSVQTNYMRTSGLDRLTDSRTSINSLLNRAECLTMAVLNYGMAACGTVVGGDIAQKHHPNPTAPFQWKSTLQDIRGRCTGLCLDCVRAGGKNDGAVSTCRIMHV